ncbi:hypothetical protein POM88_033625 [Heracleum sosnowskyi]|uniref:Transposase-associated domain-containing protein n=1 Tax=Heracleum sosnowskyi TaxID=360622 RepID=A0AAD8MCS3_9APIA|nr:hypothetical protein POM88_033625 [Heracleum sosnowskyi]
MASDHIWVGRNRYNEAKYLTDEYKIGVDRFIQFAIDNLQEEDNGLIRCSCRECKNKWYKNPSTVKVDLYRHGIMQWYTRWNCHREEDMPREEVRTSSVNTNYRDDDILDAINIKEMLKPHYFSQRAWNSICDHWGTPEFNMKSEKGKKARMMVEFTPRTGAKPFDQRREV